MDNLANNSRANPQAKWWYIFGSIALGVAVLLICGLIFFFKSTSAVPNKSAVDQKTAATENTNSDSESNVPPVMNVPDIMTGNYETIKGTWVNAAGDKLIIDGDDDITWTAGEDRIAINRFSLTPKYTKSPIIGTVTRNNSSAKITWNAPDINGFGNSYSLGFYPDGTKILSNDSTPLDKFYDGERIVALPGNADARYWVDNQNVEPFIYYRVTDQEHLVAIRDAAANVPTMHNISCTAPTPHAFPCAGSPAPADALEIPVIAQYDDLGDMKNLIIAGLIFPAQKIYCDFTVDDTNPSDLECMDMMWSSKNPKLPVTFPEPDPHAPGGPTIHFHAGDVPKFDGHRSDIMTSQAGEIPDEYIKTPLIMEPGQTATYKKWVCAAQPDVLTCWNTVTGHGAAFGRDVFETF